MFPCWVRRSCFLHSLHSITLYSPVCLNYRSRTMPTTLQELQRWIDAPSETEQLEFKEAKTQYDNTKLFRHCVALANEGGGTLIPWRYRFAASQGYRHGRIPYARRNSKQDIRQTWFPRRGGSVESPRWPGTDLPYPPSTTGHCL